MRHRAAIAEAACGLAAMLLFVLYFAVHCFRYPPPTAADLGRHCAAVASLYRNFLHPSHEAMRVPGNQSEVHTPYIIAVAALGRSLGVTPYRALQFAGVANLVFYAWAVWFFFRTFSALPGSWIVPVSFLLVSLFLRNRLFAWSSETSFASVRWIPAYPAFFAWGVALTGFALAEHFFRRPRVLPLLGIGFLVGILLLSHNLTGTWMIGILGLRALWELHEKSEERRAAALGLAVVAGVLLTLCWPYFDILRSAVFLRIPEASGFGDHPFADMAGLYAVAVPAALLFLLLWRHRFWVAAFGATFLALQAFRAFGINFGNRYAFFQAFFAQAFVAETIGFGAALLLRRKNELPENVPSWPVLRWAFVALGSAALVLTAASPAARDERRHGRPLLSFQELFELPSTHDTYYARLGEIGERLKDSDVVMMPVEHAAWDVPSITGARVVASLSAYRVPDYGRRCLDVHRFFSAGTDPHQREAILRSYRVTKILLTPTVRDREAELAPVLGPAVARNASLALFEVRQPPSERLRQRDGISDRPPVIQVGDRSRVTVADQAALVDPDGAAAVFPDGRQRVRHQENGLSRPPELLHPRVALQLKPLVAHGERLVHEQDVGLRVGRDREGETRRHARRVGADGSVDELLELRPLDDPRSPALHLRAREAQKRALEHDVLAARQFAVKSEAELEERRGAADHDHAAGARRHDARDQPQERALSGAVAPDDAHALAP